MKILLYLLIPVLIVAAAAGIAWLRDRQPTSLESGVDAFQREMRALSPDAGPGTRRRPDGSPVQDGPRPPDPADPTDPDRRPPERRPPERRPPGRDR